MNLYLYAHVLHIPCILTMFHAFRCVIDYCEMCAERLWNKEICFSIYGCDVSLSSLSLSRIDCAWHLSANPLWLGTLLVLGLPLLILPFPLFMFGSVMGRPNRTSLKNFRNMAFIWNTMLFYHTFPTFLSLRSFRLRAKNLFMRDPWDVPSCLYRSFTPINTVSIPLYLGLPWHFEVHIL